LACWTNPSNFPSCWTNPSIQLLLKLTFLACWTSPSIHITV
jgi:hypothetical protein